MRSDAAGAHERLFRSLNRSRAYSLALLSLRSRFAMRHRLPAASVNFVSLIHGIHEADVVSIVVAGVNPKFV